MSLRTKIRVALVGLEFGSAFVPLYLHHPNVEYLAICDLNERKLTQIGPNSASRVASLIWRTFSLPLPMMRFTC